MTRAYEETYLNDAMNNLGDMLDYAICDLGYEPEKFYSQFLESEIAELFGIGAPKFIAGLSGPEYWAGWALAYYQWYTACS